MIRIMGKSSLFLGNRPKPIITCVRCLYHTHRVKRGDIQRTEKRKGKNRPSLVFGDGEFKTSTSLLKLLSTMTGIETIVPWHAIATISIYIIIDECGVKANTDAGVNETDMKK